MTAHRGFLFSLILVIFQTVWSFMETIPSEHFEYCSEEHRLNSIADGSDFKIITESDDDFFMNGTMKFLKKMTGHVRSRVFAERWHRDTWVLSVESKHDDGCAALEDITLPIYQFFEHQKKCPFQAGVSFY